MTTVLYLEDLNAGRTFGSGRLKVDEQRVKSFAAEFDPQPFHLDDAAARKTIFRGLAASGWHTAAMTMRLLVESEFRPAGGIVGAGFDEFKWPRPVRPGDELHLLIEVLEVRPSKSRPEQGMVKLRTTTLNQNEKPVQVSVGNLVVPPRPASPPLASALHGRPNAGGRVGKIQVMDAERAQRVDHRVRHCGNRAHRAGL